MNSAHKILLIEDTREMQILVSALLQKKFSVQVAASLAVAREELKRHTFSLIILDVELPDGDGFKFCAQLKLDEKHRQTPLIFLSGKRDLSDKVMGLSLGADDYIVKPLEPLEFQARVEARIRNVEDLRQGQENFFVGPFRVIPSQQKILFSEAGTEIPFELTNMEFKLFYFLLKNPDQIFSREQILNGVWGQLTNVNDRTVDTHVYTLRQKLGTFGACVQAVPRVGYKYSPPVTAKVA